MSENRPSANPEAASEPYIGALFAHASNFVIESGNFTNINYPPPSKPPNFREIPIGELILSHEIRSNEARVVRRRRARTCVRRMYSAEIVGLQNQMTVAVIEGQGAEKEWNAEISLYSNLRHPYVLQLFGVGHTPGGIHALIFHDDLVPWRDFQQQYDQSHFAQVSLCMCLHMQLEKAYRYMASASGRALTWDNYTAWIRPSKGILHLELTAPESWKTTLSVSPMENSYFPDSQSTLSFLTPFSASEIFNWMSLESYHPICARNLVMHHWFTASADSRIPLGSVFHAPWIDFDDALEIAFARNTGLICRGWCAEDPDIQHYWSSITSDQGISILPNGWIRIDSAYVIGKYSFDTVVSDDPDNGWLAQAWHFFNALDVNSQLSEYVLIHTVKYSLNLLGPLEDLPAGYLFLGPVNEDNEAYWSVNPSDTERLTTAEADNLGFPEIQAELQVMALYWSDGLYAGIRQFHAAKGYDADGFDVAIELGCPLYELACTREEFRAHLRDLESDDESSDSEEGSTCQGSAALAETRSEEVSNISEGVRRPGTEGLENDELDSLLGADGCNGEMTDPADLPIPTNQRNHIGFSQFGMTIIQVQLALLVIAFGCALCDTL